jgi:hypothetical protein
MSDFHRHSPLRWGTDPASPAGAERRAAPGGDNRWLDLHPRTRLAVALALLSWLMYLVVAAVAFTMWKRDGWAVWLPTGVLFGLLGIYLPGLWVALRREDAFERRMRFTAWASLAEFVTLVEFTGALAYIYLLRLPGGVGTHPEVVLAVLCVAVLVTGRVMWSWRRWRSWRTRQPRR